MPRPGHPYLSCVWGRVYTDQVFVLPLEYDKADYRVLVAFIREKLEEDKRIDRSTPGLLRVHALAPLSVLVDLVLWKSGTRQQEEGIDTRKPE